MEYRVRFFGIVGIGLGVPPGEPIVFDLPGGATYGDLLDAIGERFDSRFPPNVWDPRTRSFHPQVLSIADDRMMSAADREVGLCEGGVANFFVPIAGG